MASFDRQKVANQLRGVAELCEIGGAPGLLKKAIGEMLHTVDGRVGPCTVKYNELVRAKTDRQLVQVLGTVLGMLGRIYSHHSPHTRPRPMPDNAVDRLRLLADKLAVDSKPEQPELPQVNLDLNQIKYAGECYEVSGDAALLFSKLVEHYPHPFPASSLFANPSRVKNSLPDILKAMIESQPAKGYRLILPK